MIITTLQRAVRGGLKHNIDRTDDGKGNFIIASVEPSSKEGAIGPVDVTLTGNVHQGTTDGNYYYLTYNPYMATLDMKRFFANAKNKAALGEDNVSYWVVNDNETNGIQYDYIEWRDGWKNSAYAGFLHQVENRSAYHPLRYKHDGG